MIIGSHQQSQYQANLRRKKHSRSNDKLHQVANRFEAFVEQVLIRRFVHIIDVMFQYRSQFTAKRKRKAIHVGILSTMAECIPVTQVWCFLYSAHAFGKLMEE